MPILAERHRLVELFPALSEDAVRPIDERARVLALLDPTSSAEQHARAAVHVIRLVVRRVAAAIGGAAAVAAAPAVIEPEFAIAGDTAFGEGAFLRAVLDALATESAPACSLLRAALRGYGVWLEEAGRFEESLAVLSLVSALPSPEARLSDAVGLALQAGRLRTALGEWAAATYALDTADRWAATLGEHTWHGRIALARVRLQRRTGDTIGAAASLDAVHATARRQRDDALRSDVLLEMAALALDLSRPADAVDASYRALGTAADDVQRAQVLLALGRALHLSGAAAPASHALAIVPTLRVATTVHAAAIGELLEVTAVLGDRLMFERWWRAAQAQFPMLSSGARIGLHCRAASGYARFGNRIRAREMLLHAHASARFGLLFDWMRSIDQLLASLDTATPEPPPLIPVAAPMLARVERGLAAFVGARAVSA